MLGYNSQTTHVAITAFKS